MMQAFSCRDFAQTFALYETVFLCNMHKTGCQGRDGARSGPERVTSIPVLLSISPAGNGNPRSSGRKIVQSRPLTAPGALWYSASCLIAIRPPPEPAFCSADSGQTILSFFLSSHLCLESDPDHPKAAGNTARWPSLFLSVLYSPPGAYRSAGGIRIPLTPSVSSRAALSGAGQSMIILLL